ncbi:MAG: hypothetical protein QOI51_403 [Nocardioidaceae bacterium]|nr:hypothetical protein [Nocardioidaceae bacterium]
MSETPQTPPPPEPPPPGSGGATGGPTGRSAGGYSSDQMKAAVQGTDRYDLGIIGAGERAFRLSLIPGYYTASVPGFSDNFNAWHGFFGWFAALLALVGAGLLAARLFANVTLPVPLRLTVLGLFGAAFVFTIIAGLTWAGLDTHGVDVGKYTGHGVIYWLSLIVILAGGALAFLRKDVPD